MKRVVAILAILTLLSFAGQSKADLIVNGGFETADFTGWTVNAGATGVAGNFDGYRPHSGNFFAALGHVGTPIGSISQSITTTVGDSYTLSLFLGSDGALPNQFVVQWNGTTLYDQSSLPDTRSNPSGQYNLLSFTVVGTGSDTLTFLERNDPAYLALDDVTLVLAPTNAVPEPASMVLVAMGGLGMAGVRFIRRRATSVVAS